MSLNIALRIFDTAERNRVTSLFEMIKQRLNGNWRMTDCQAANVVIIDGADPGSEAFLLACKASCQSLPIVYSMNNDLDAEFFLQWPARASQLADILNGLSADMDLEPTIAEGSPHLPHFDETTDCTHLPQVAETLLMLMKSQPGFSYIELGAGELIFNSNDGSFYALPETMIERFLPEAFLQCRIEDLTDIKVKPMSNERFSELQEQLVSISSRELLWTTNLYYSNGKISEKLEEDAVIRLNSWPDLTHLPHQPIHTILATNLLRDGCCIDQLARDLCIPESTVNNFINACLTLGLIEEVCQHKEQGENVVKGHFMDNMLQRFFA